MAADDMPVEAVDLLARLMQSNHDHVTHIYKELLVAYKAEAEALREGVEAALQTAVYGGTTAEYEQVLARVGNAMYPSPERMAAYRARAEAFVRGEPESVHPVHGTGPR